MGRFLGVRHLSKSALPPTPTQSTPTQSTPTQSTPTQSTPAPPPLKIAVDPQTSTLLETVRKCLAETRSLIPEPGNVSEALARTQYLAAKKTDEAREASYEHKRKSRNKRSKVGREATFAVEAQGGNCHEYAHVLAALLNQHLPIGTRIAICSAPAQEVDGEMDEHMLVLVGEPQPQGQQIVADAWSKQDTGLLRKDSDYKDTPLAVNVEFRANGQDIINKRKPKVKVLPQPLPDTFEIWLWEQLPPRPVTYRVDLALPSPQQIIEDDISALKSVKCPQANSQSMSTLPTSDIRSGSYGSCYTTYKARTFLAKADTDGTSTLSLFHRFEDRTFQVPWSEIGGPEVRTIAVPHRNVEEFLLYLQTNGRWSIKLESLFDLVGKKRIRSETTSEETKRTRPAAPTNQLYIPPPPPLFGFDFDL